MNRASHSLRIRSCVWLLGLLWVACADERPLSPAARELLHDEVAFLTRAATRWVGEARDVARQSSEPLTAGEKNKLAAFFPPEVLETARIAVVPKLPTPEFSAVYRELGRQPPLDFSTAIGLALDDTILLVESHAKPDSAARLSVLFHELVHLTQYRMLGTADYIELYIQVFADNDFNYRSNPFEIQAFELQNRYRRQPEKVFSVAEEVQRRWGGRLR